MAKSSKKQKITRLGHYEIIEEIGRGGMAIVYKGLQSSLNRTVAIKVLPPNFAKDEEFIARFDRESETIANLNHPNIIQIIDRGKEEKTCYFVMEYVDGLNLDEFLKQRSLTYRQTLVIALDTCRALAYAHSKGIVHRDLKPSNILVARDTLTVKVADFGLVQLAQSAGELSTLTQSNIAMGTLEYMSPEQRKDARAVDCRADIFSFGIILYEMFTGKLPVGHFKKPSEINPELPRTLDEVILRCLKPNPEERYQTAGECAEALKNLLRVDSGTLDKIVRTVKTAKDRASTAIRNKPKHFLLAVGGIILAFVLFFVFRSCRREDAEAPARVSSPPTVSKAPARVVKEAPAAPKEAPAVPKALVTGGAENAFKKAESYAGADMKSTSLRQFAVMSMRSVVENYKESDPDWAEKAQLRIGQIYEEAGEIDLAIAEYRRLLTLFPSGALRPNAQFRIAGCLKPTGFFSGFDFNRTEKIGKAIEEFQKVYVEYPSSPFAPKALFEIALLQAQGKSPEDYAAAISSLEIIHRNYPQSEEAPRSMAKIAVICNDNKVHDYEKSIQTYEDLLKRYPDHEDEFHILFNIAGIIEWKYQDQKEAIEAYRRVIREKTGTKDALKANQRIEKLLQMSQPAK